MNTTSANGPYLRSGRFYGETIRQYHAAGFSLSETRYLPRTALPRHSHESHYFCFVLSGSYSESYDRKVRRCEPSTVLYHPSGELHEQRFDKTAVNLFRIEIDPLRLNHQSLPVSESRARAAVGLAYKLYQEFREPDPVSHLAIEGLCLELIARLVRDCNHEKGVPPLWLTQAYELITSRYLEQLTLADIAGAVGIHPGTLARVFRHSYDCTVGEMVRRKRINFACDKLRERDASVADVAIAAGFYDQSHFARTFKKITGFTPAQYRRHCGTR